MSNDPTHAERQARYRERQQARVVELEKEVARLRAAARPKASGTASSRDARPLPKTRDPILKVCKNCGREFQSRDKRQVYCPSGCGEAVEKSYWHLGNFANACEAHLKHLTKADMAKALARVQEAFDARQL